MVDNVISIIGSANYTEPNQELIEALEQLVIKAKEGHIKSMAYIATGNGTVESSWIIEDGGNIFEVLGALSVLNLRIIKENIQI